MRTSLAIRTGTSRRKVLPWRGVLSTVIVPPIACAMRQLMATPDSKAKRIGFHSQNEK
jgi:hypothetical protein